MIDLHGVGGKVANSEGDFISSFLRSMDTDEIIVRIFTTIFNAREL